MANPAVAISELSDREWLEIGRKVNVLIKKKIRNGIPPGDAVVQAFAESGYNQKVSDSTVKAVINSMQAGVDSKLAIPYKKAVEITLLNHYDSGGVVLSDRIWSNVKNVQVDVINTMTAQWKKNKAWTTVAQKIQETVPVKGDIPAIFGELNDLGRKAISGDISALKDFRKALSQAERQANRLTGIPVSTDRLKETYLDSINKIKLAVNRNSIRTMDRAIDRAIFEKARSNALRLSRTEASNAYFEGFKNRLLQDSRIIGWKSVLSTSHTEKDYDICNYYAEADLHGMGDGVYPKENSPQIPYHPNCMCTPIPVSVGNVDSVEPDSESAIEHIASLSDSDKTTLLGRRGSKMFEANPESWNELIKGNSEYVENTLSSIAEKIFKK